jgi:hypothetical protein
MVNERYRDVLPMVRSTYTRFLDLSRFAGLRHSYLGKRGHQILSLVAVDGFKIHVRRGRFYARHSTKKSGAEIVNLAGLRREMRESCEFVSLVTHAKGRFAPRDESALH